VLLLGDSFANIYSLAALGWGEAAGLAEHLSMRLGRPVDALLRNSDGAFATRQILQRELASGRDRLRGKRLVVWEFAARELAFGDWRLLPLELGGKHSGAFISPAKGAKMRVAGTVFQISPVPRAGSVPYKEHIVSLHLVDVRSEGDTSASPGQCLAYAWSMKDQRHTVAASLRPGDTISVEISPWEDVSDALEKFQRSELDDAALLTEPAVWIESL
jgi:alginate O-acetyltransferase complex protein AlgJ